MLEATGPHLPMSPSRPDTMRKAAQDLEATFLAEMLKSAGFGQSSEAFGGGAGEEQFSSFLVQAQADAMVQAGGLGLTEIFFNALMEADND
ncbi:MAG: flagellar biosynthesis protein FlgJ [Rhodobacteraceae bacterium]|nr:MAG: flagellar biosynthesis protein FlgJ [Paracoccaceae bacterium]